MCVRILRSPVLARITVVCDRYAAAVRRTIAAFVARFGFKADCQRAGIPRVCRSLRHAKSECVAALDCSGNAKKRVVGLVHAMPQNPNRRSCSSSGYLNCAREACRTLELKPACCVFRSQRKDAVRKPREPWRCAPANRETACRGVCEPWSTEAVHAERFGCRCAPQLEA